MFADMLAAYIMALMAGSVAGSVPAPPADTLIPVDPGTRVSVRNHLGSIAVRAWERDAVQVAWSGPAGARVDAERSDGTLRLRGRGRHGEPVRLDLTVTVPARSAIDLHGPFIRIDVEGARSNVTAETVEGSIRVRGAEGVITLRTIDGDIRVEGALGRVQVSSVDGEVWLSDVAGDVSVDVIDGDIRLEGVRSSNVKATTVDGDILFRGSFQPEGHYRLSTHDGDVVVVVPEDTHASVSVATFGGDFVSSFAIPAAARQEGKRFQFTLGDGSARVELQSFDGEIRLLRPGEPIPRPQ